MGPLRTGESMSPIHSAHCSADDAELLMRNTWKYVRVRTTHMRIHPPDSYATATPSAPVQYIATVEVLNQEDKTCGEAERACAAVIGSLFPSFA